MKCTVSAHRHTHAAVALAAALLALSACASAPKSNDALDQARAAYERASADALVVRHAPEQLDDANRALRVAEVRWAEKDAASGIDHLAYLAARRVEIAELIAEAREAERELESMKLERQRVQLDLRASELDRSRAEIEQARLEAEELKRQLEELEAKQTERGIVLTLGDVLFDSEKAMLTPDAAENIDRIAAFMDSYPERRAVVEGHTDSMGDEDFNMDLSRERAFAVRQALAARGISTIRISIEGFGEDVPVAENSTADGRQQNRRVEIIFPDSAVQLTELEDD